GAFPVHGSRLRPVRPQEPESLLPHHAHRKPRYGRSWVNSGKLLHVGSRAVHIVRPLSAPADGHLPIDSHLLRWEIVPARDAAQLPRAIVTQGAPFEHDGMPAEVAMLLPSNDGPTALVDRLVEAPGHPADIVAGLFLASVFFNLRVEA